MSFFDQLEFLGQSPWWMALSTLIGLALLVYAARTWRALRPVAAATDLAQAHSAAAAVPAPAARLPRWLPLASVIAGLAALAGTALLALIHGWFSRDASHRETSRSIPLFLLLTCGICVILFYRGVYTALTPARRITLITLRLLGMITLLALLFQPVLATVDAPAARPSLAIVVDASASMGYNDAPNQPNRFRQSALAIQNSLLPQLQKAYDIHVYAYDGKQTDPLASADALDKVLPNGEVTDLGAALNLPREHPEQMILFSDGIHNGPITIDAELKASPPAAPVHAVRVGSTDMETSTVPDIAVVSIDGPQTAIVNNQITLTATIRSTAMSDRTIRVVLTDKDAPTGASPLEEQRLVLCSSPSGQTVQLHFTPDKVGRAVVRVQVPVDPGERSDANNQQDFSLLVTDPKLAVLYIEGRVRPEVGPLRRLLEQDPNIALVSLVQTVAGRFDPTGLKPGDDLTGIPKTLAQWKRFKVILLGDLDASFLNAQQLRDLDQVVREGAGLVMIGGQNSFNPGGWDKTALAQLLPVSLEKETPAQINTPFVPELTAVGSAHPIFRNITPFFLNSQGQKIGDTVPDLSGCVALGPPKPGATVLAVHPTEKIAGQPATVLAVQPYGKGRTAAFAADTTFHWSLTLRALGKDSPYNRFWGQMIRWLASEENLTQKTGASVTALLGKERFESGEPVALRAAVTDKDGRATAYAAVAADITSPDGKTAHVALAPAGSTGADLGIYNSAGIPYKPAMAGTYKVTFNATKDNAPLGKDDTTFRVLPVAGEHDVLAAQPETLRKIDADRRDRDLSGLEDLVAQLLRQRPTAPDASLTSIPLSQPRPFFLVFIGLIAAEWFLRRKWQLQ